MERSFPAFFIPNAGQAAPGIRYMVETPGLNAGFTATSAVFQLDRLTLRVEFQGANPNAAIEGQERLNAAANFLIGSQSQNWKTNLPTYQKILYRNLYPGIDMTYGAVGHRIKSEFLVAPGADPKLIRLRYSGAERISIEPSGELLVRGAHTEAREEAPVIFQNGMQIPGRYILLDAQTVGFEIDAFDSSLPLLIDPVLSYATYLGGTGMSAVTGLAVDSSGDLYATGWTESLNFQIAAPIQASNGGGVDAFVVKLNPSGTSLLYATYIGGTGDDRGAGIAVDSSGEAYVTGSTESTNFPVVNAVSSKLGGGQDAFALKINGLGNLLVYSTYLGGTNTDYGYAIAVDSSGNAYVSGDTLSANFPVSSGAAQTKFGGTQNVFVTKLTSAGAISYSTFLGGSGVDNAGGIALDSSANAYVAGGTTSANFPIQGAIQSSSGGYQDAFLTKISASGAQFLYSTYLGGNGGGGGSPEEATAVAVDSSGNAYIAGSTNSTNFPVTAGAFQTQFVATQAAFVAKVNPAGNALVYSTYLGGSAFNWASGIAVATGGIAYVDGFTSSFDFPLVAASAGHLRRHVRRLCFGLQCQRQFAQFLDVFWRHRLGFGQRPGRRFQRQHIHRRADQLSQPDYSRPDPSHQQRNGHRLAGAAGSHHGDRAAASRRGRRNANFRLRKYGYFDSPVFGSRGDCGAGLDHGADQLHGLFELRMPGDLFDRLEPIRAR